jgi:SAM-dependent methyltransferase
MNPGAAVLDVGCGYGATLRTFAKADARTYGVEPSPHRARAARLLGAQVAPIPIEDLTPDTFGRRFELVVTHHVLEHVLDPHAYLRVVRNVLSPRGWLYIAVPNARNDFLLQHAFYALHVHLFSRASLEWVLARAGFIPQRVAEDHQLRILARREDDGVTPRATDRGAMLKADEVLARMLGPRYRDYPGRETYCKWTLLPAARMARDAYRVEWSSARDPLRDRVIGMRFDEEFELPVVFEKRDTAGPTPFWVK